jgi:Uma2 family endonuclease
MALHDLRRKLTYEDYSLLPEDGRRHEILDGEHRVTPAPFLRHQRISIRLSSRLFAFAELHGLGEVLTAPTDVVLSPHDIVQPDILFVSRERAAILREENVRGAPDLVVEILSPGTRGRDQGIKLERYDRLGVREYWTLDPDRRLAMIYPRFDGRLRRLAEVSPDTAGTLTTPLLPGLEIPLSDILE